MRVASLPSLIFLILMTLLGATACRKPQLAPRPPDATTAGFTLPVMPVTTTPTPGAPAWIDNPTVLEHQIGGIAAVGMSPKSVLGDTYFQRSEAHARGTNMMAKEINNRIRSAYTGTTKATTSGSVAGAFQTADALREDTLQQLVDMELSGVHVLYYWTDVQTGTLYCLLHLNPQDFRAIYNQFAAKMGPQGGLDDAVKRLNTSLQK